MYKTYLFFILLLLVGCSNKTVITKEFKPENIEMLGNVLVFNTETIYGDLQKKEWFREHKENIVRLKESETYEMIIGDKKIVAYSLGKEMGFRKDIKIISEVKENIIYLNVTGKIKDVPREPPFPADIIFISIDQTKHKLEIIYEKKREM